MVDLNSGARPPVLLTEELLEGLAARWRAQGMPIADALRPGLSDDEIDRLTAPLGLTLPREARTWWGWHDGAEFNVRGSSNIGPLRVFEPLSVAVHATAQTREMMRGADGVLAPMWQESWLRMSASEGVVVIDCGVDFEDCQWP
jgi:cell wall assembly regulator SMI1